MLYLLLLVSEPEFKFDELAHGDVGEINSKPFDFLHGINALSERDDSVFGARIPQPINQPLSAVIGEEACHLDKQQFCLRVHE
jgi:hypothetical protein